VRIDAGQTCNNAGVTNWDDLRVFLAVRRHGTHAAAARALSVDATTVGRRIAALESALGGRLFRRTRAGLFMTDEGVQLALRAERIEREVLESERLLSGHAAVAGTVRLTASDGILTYVLAPALGELVARHPGLQLELRGDNRALDLSRREADVAVRLARPTESSLVARRLGVARFGLFASESYLARRGRPASEEALRTHELLGYEPALDRTPPMLWWLRRAGGTLRLRSSSTAALAAACVAGQGIALLLVAVARSIPGLVRVLPAAEIPRRELWGVVHADLRRQPRVVAVLDWAASSLDAAGLREP
jgi:DNA-binding transcriptional LysR family regulator